MRPTLVKESEMVDAINTLSAVFARSLKEQKLYSIKETKLNKLAKNKRTNKKTYICAGCKNIIYIPGMIINTYFDTKYYCSILCTNNQS